MADHQQNRTLFDPEFCEKRCPICTRARQGRRWAKFLLAIETVLTFGGCPFGRARKRKYGVPPSEALPDRRAPVNER